MKCTFFFSVSLGFLLLSGLRAQTTPENEILDLSQTLGNKQILTLPLTTTLPLFDTPCANRVLLKLPANQTLTVLAMNRFGLKVRGEGKNGPINGWISQKTAFNNDPKALGKLVALYQRQQLVERLILEKKVAIGMTLPEITRILGPPSRHQISAETGHRLETVIWTRTGPVNLAESVEDSQVTLPELNILVEIGRLTATLEEGVTTAIYSNLDPRDQPIPEIEPPVKHPFTTALLTSR